VTQEATFSGDIDKTSPSGLEAKSTLQCREAKKIILKCTECGNTFAKEKVIDGQVVTCPVCDADYQVMLKDGKVCLKDFMFEEKDLGEL
jgi:hypothetical protein